MTRSHVFFTVGKLGYYKQQAHEQLIFAQEKCYTSIYINIYNKLLANTQIKANFWIKEIQIKQIC